MISRKGLRKEEVQRKIRDRIKIEEKEIIVVIEEMIIVMIWETLTNY